MKNRAIIFGVFVFLYYQLIEFLININNPLFFGGAIYAIDDNGTYVGGGQVCTGPETCAYDICYDYQDFPSNRIVIQFDELFCDLSIAKIFQTCLYYPSFLAIFSVIIIQSLIWIAFEIIITYREWKRKAETSLENFPLLTPRRKNKVESEDLPSIMAILLLIIQIINNCILYDDLRSFPVSKLILQQVCNLMFIVAFFL